MTGMVAGGQEGGAEFDESAAWLAFYVWQIDQQAALAAMSHVDRFEATRDKLRELGLPEAIPWATVRTP